jgi:uncharacterized protein (DUF1800 family)
MKRRELLTLELPVKKKGQDFSHRDRTLSGLTPYTGPWTMAEVKHLLRRAMFSATKADVEYFVNAGMASTISELLTPEAVPSPPIRTYTDAEFTDADVPFGQTWVSAPFNPQATGVRMKSLKAWWTGLILNQGRSIQEKMTLFWSTHFTTETAGVPVPQFSYKTNVLYRQYALGNFKTLTKQITIDPGMLMYLNGYLNTNVAPDENYGRELQELFTVGKDPNGIPYYTESDVQMAAKILTGHTINPSTLQYYFEPVRHDIYYKVFSSHYNNITIPGRTGAAGATELDDLLDMIFVREEVALNVCRKLYRFFVYYEIDSAAETNVIQPLAAIFRNNNYEILPVLSALFNSEHFYDSLNRACLIKAPLDFLVSFCKDYGVVFPDSSDLTGQYNMWFYLSQFGAILTQNIGDPPNVAGWPAYYQEPQFHEIWINTTTLPYRNMFTDAMLYFGLTYMGNTIQADVVGYTETLSDPLDPNNLIQEVIDRHYGVDVSQNIKDYLKSILLNGQTNDSYWSVAWDDYINDPGNMTYYNIVLTRLRSMYKYLMNLSEYQLS